MQVIRKLDLLIFQELTKDLTRKWSINELAKSLNLHYRPVYAAVQELIKKEFIIKDRNNLIGPCYKNNLLLELGEKQRHLRLRKELKLIKSKLEKNIKHSFYSVVLFGSSVYKKGKDIDLLFIISNPEKLSMFESNVRKALGSYENLVDLNIITEKSAYEMLNNPNQINVMNEIMKNHLVLIGIENFYRIIQRWKNAY